MEEARKKQRDAASLYHERRALGSKRGHKRIGGAQEGTGEAAMHAADSASLLGKKSQDELNRPRFKGENRFGTFFWFLFAHVAIVGGK